MFVLFSFVIFFFLFPVALKDPEVQVLQALHAPNVFLPTVVGDLENAILMTPVLQHFRSDVKLTGQHVRDLCGTLAHIHGTGRVHRDLRSDNIMCDHLHAYIIDLGYALNKTDEPVAFAGAKRTACNRVLEELLAGGQNFVYDYQDDVESLVKVFFSSLSI